MKVFISWSGERSHRIALLMREWIQVVIQAADAWISGEDVTPGALWLSQFDNISGSTNSIVCLTNENKESPVLLYETGVATAMLGTLSSYLLLIDLKPIDVKGPLAQLNHVEPTKEGMLRLLSNINNNTAEYSKLKEDILNKTFEVFWPNFELSFNSILAETEIHSAPKVVRNDSDILSEILELSRRLDKRVGALEAKSSSDLEEIVGSKRSEEGLLSANVPVDYYIKFWLARDRKVEVLLSEVARRYPGIAPEEIAEMIKLFQVQE